MTKIRQAASVVDRLTAGNNSTLLVWFVLSVVVNLALAAERVGVVEFHPENLEGVYALLEHGIEGFLRWGTLAVTFIVGIRALGKRLKTNRRGGDE